MTSTLLVSSRILTIIEVFHSLSLVWKQAESTSDLAGMYSTPQDLRQHLVGVWQDNGVDCHAASGLSQEQCLDCAVRAWQEARRLSGFMMRPSFTS